MKTYYSWNVNGIRAAEKKGLFEWMEEVQPDALCIQETKANPDQLNEKFMNPGGYHSFWSSAVKKGYSGTMIYTKEEPLATGDMEAPAYDSEGRIRWVEFSDHVLISAYFPNSQHEGKRLDYKLGFNRTIHEFCNSWITRGKQPVLCGDFNVAHKEIDLANPKTNTKNPGFLPEERAWMSEFIDAGYRDTFRMFNQEPGQYSWWTYRAGARARNVGWRIDYFAVHGDFADRLESAAIHPEVMGSDHCPVSLTLKD